MQPTPPGEFFLPSSVSTCPPCPLYSSNIPDKFDRNNLFFTVNCRNCRDEKNQRRVVFMKERSVHPRHVRLSGRDHRVLGWLTLDDGSWAFKNISRAIHTGAPVVLASPIEPRAGRGAIRDEKTVDRLICRRCGLPSDNPITGSAETSRGSSGCRPAATLRQAPGWGAAGKPPMREAFGVF